MSVIDVLKPHNLEAFQEIDKLINSGTKKIAVPRATGSGKTYLMGALAEKYNNERKLVLEPTRPLLNSIKEKFDEFGIANTDFMTYQKLIRMSDEDIAAMDYKLIFLDEAHHGTAPKWGQKINYLMETHSDSIICGTSATTVRNDGVNVVESLFENNAIGELPLSTAIARKVLPCPHYITAIYRLNDEFEKLKKRIEASTNTKEEKKEFYEKTKTMQSHFEKSYGIPTILNKYIKAKNGRYLVFCKNRKHLDTMRDVVIDWFRTAGIKDVHSYAIYSDYPDKEKDYKEFCEDNSDSCKILFSINMLNEGLHIKNISGVLMLRTTQSNLIYLQQLGRLLEAGNMDKYLLVFDFVNNFSSVNDGIGLLKEIKDAVAREKESDPDFNDSGFEDIDTFFVLEQVVEIQEMFAEIEGRLEGDWDVRFKEYCEFYEENGHGDVPKTEEYRQLSNWCKHQRQDLDNGILKEERKELLNDNGFVWDVPKYRFEKQVIETRDFILKNGRYPNSNAENKFEKRLGGFVIHERQKRNDKESVYPQWKIDYIRQSELYDFFEGKSSRFDKFYKNVLLYKEKFGHTNIKMTDSICGYKIGSIYFQLVNDYQNEKLNEEQINKLREIGIDITKKNFDKRYEYKLQLAKKAVNDGIIISRRNQEYKGINFYNWITQTIKRKYNDGEMSSEEMEIIENLINNSLYKMCDHRINLVKVIDKLENTEIGIYFSSQKAIEDIREKYGLKICNMTIRNRLNGKITTPYKGRFMFYYATDEEIKKYLEDCKTK